MMHAKALYLRFCAIYDHKFVKTYHDEDFKSLWAHEWSTGLSTITPNVIKDALEHCKKNLDWPPSISEFIKICESYLGVPTLQECMKLAVDRNFNHPLVLICFEKVGSWAMKNDAEKQLLFKFELAYQEALNKFREEPSDTWLKLEAYNAKPKELPAPSKIPTTSESKAFRECMNKCQEILHGKKIAGGGKTHKEFDATMIKKGHKDFDQAVFDEYKDYLMNIPEVDTMILPPVYLLDRNKFLNMRDQGAWLEKQGYVPPNQREGFVGKKEAPRSGNGRPTQVYKSWNRD